MGEALGMEHTLNETSEEGLVLEVGVCLGELVLLGEGRERK